jgi:hypothetical protein
MSPAAAIVFNPSNIFFLIQAVGLVSLLAASTLSFKLQDKNLETNEIEDINPSYNFQYKVTAPTGQIITEYTAYWSKAGAGQRIKERSQKVRQNVVFIELDQMRLRMCLTSDGGGGGATFLSLASGPTPP